MRSSPTRRPPSERTSPLRPATSRTRSPPRSGGREGLIPEIGAAATIALLSLSGDQRAAWLGFLDFHNRVVKELDDELERKHGLSLSTYSILATLIKSPERRLRMSELADDVLISRPGMTRLIERLERDGLVERSGSETDSRQVYAQITDRGLGRLGDANKTHFQGVRTRFLDRLSATQTQALARASGSSCSAGAPLLRRRAGDAGGPRSVASREIR